MKKLLLTASVVALFAAFTAPAHAECDGIYGAFRAGQVKHKIKGAQDNIDNARLMMSGALGYRWEYFRTELEYIWRKYNKDTNVNKTLFKTYSYMWNVYYDVLPYNWWSPYVGAGLGYTKVRFFQSNGFFASEDWDRTKFTWSLGGGLSLKVTNRLNFDLGYRFYNMGKPKGDGKAYPVKAQEIYGGIRYVF